MADGAPAAERETKVERLIDQYDLEAVAEDLAARWTADDDERDSLRELARDVNIRVLDAALEAAEVDALAGEVENYYRLLRDDDVSAGRRTEARTTLEQAGVDVAALEADFVSHQAIHTFLTERVGVSYEGPAATERIERSRDSIQRLEGRVESVAESTIERLAAAGDLEVGDVSVIPSVDVLCTDCGHRYDFEALLEAGGCACRDAE